MTGEAEPQPGFLPFQAGCSAAEAALRCRRLTGGGPAPVTNGGPVPAMLGGPGRGPAWQRLSHSGWVGKQPGSWAVEPAGLPLLRTPGSPKPPAEWDDFMENGGLCTEGGASYRGNHPLWSKLQC